VIRLLQKAANAMGGGLFLALFIVFVIQVTARFGFNKPMAWTDEAAVILYVWIILWAAAVVVHEREHVAFDLVWNSVGRRTRQVMRIVGNLLVGGLALVAIPACWDYVHFMNREGTPVRRVVHVGVSAFRDAAAGACRTRRAGDPQCPSRHRA
jgi:TRAP-type C4-dicarboxylate transport system permease small subunit